MRVNAVSLSEALRRRLLYPLDGRSRQQPRPQTTISLDSRHRGITTSPFVMDADLAETGVSDGMKGLHVPATLCHAKTTYTYT